MSKENDALRQVQELVLDIIHVERNHFIPKSDRHENVVEHSFSLSTEFSGEGLESILA